jgi:F420H(2)-dependent quinone reductase
MTHGLLDPGWPLLGTHGRATGKPRVGPVGNGLRGDTFWVITEHGDHSARSRRSNRDPGFAR